MSASDANAPCAEEQSKIKTAMPSGNFVLNISIAFFVYG